jgi:tetratricopeptide (TPR) repeat protein
MTEIQNSGSEGLECPSCHTLNNPNSEICTACGIPFHIYKEIKQELSQRVNERQNLFLKSVLEETQEKLRKDQRTLRLNFVKQLIFLLLAGLVLVPIIWGSIKIIQHKKIEQQKLFESNYQNGIHCIEVKDYQCANDYLEIVYLKNANYQDTLNALLIAKFGIVEEFYENGQVSKAIENLNTILTIDPQNIQALKLLNNYHKLLGNEYKNQERWQKAIDEFSYALEAMPDDFDAREEINQLYALWIEEESNLLKIWQIRNMQEEFNNR